MDEKAFTLVGVRMPPDLLERLDEMVVLTRTTRSNVIRVLIENAALEDVIPAALRERVAEGEDQ